MLIVGPRIIKNRSYHQLFLFGTQFHNVFDQITQNIFYMGVIVERDRFFMPDSE
jgi:hypothetical protein